jgi:hypothetical protein
MKRYAFFPTQQSENFKKKSTAIINKRKSLMGLNNIISKNKMPVS